MVKPLLPSTQSTLLEPLPHYSKGRAYSSTQAFDQIRVLVCFSGRPCLTLFLNSSDPFWPCFLYRNYFSPRPKSFYFFTMQEQTKYHESSLDWTNYIRNFDSFFLPSHFLFHYSVLCSCSSDPGNYLTNKFTSLLTLHLSESPIGQRTFSSY